MRIWYNPGLKTNKELLAQANFQHVNYPGVLAYNSMAATVEMALVGKEKKDQENSAFPGVSVGINTSSSPTGGFLAATAAMVAFSYAIPLDLDQDFLALGFQGCYNASRVTAIGGSDWPRGFDKYGPLAGAIAVDPEESGRTIGYYTVGTGLAVFHDGRQRQWYIGGSALGLNRSVTEQVGQTVDRLPLDVGVQAGYSNNIDEQNEIGYYGNLSAQGGTSDVTIGAFYTFKMDDSTGNAGTVGLACRFGDAVLPNVKIRVGKNEFGGYYFANISHAAANGYNRSGYEVSYRRFF